MKQQHHTSGGGAFTNRGLRMTIIIQRENKIDIFHCKKGEVKVSQMFVHNLKLAPYVLHFSKYFF